MENMDKGLTLPKWVGIVQAQNTPNAPEFTLILFYKQHMIKKTSWTFLDFIQSLLIFVA